MPTQQRFSRLRRRLAPGLSVLEAGVCLLLGLFLVRVLRFSRWIGWIGAATAGATQPPTAWQIRLARYVAGRVDYVADRLPWHSTCLMRAVAGRLMLRRRGIASVLHLGARPLAGAPVQDMEAHAWLCVGETVVLGAAEASDYVSVARYGDVV